MNYYSKNLKANKLQKIYEEDNFTVFERWEKDNAGELRGYNYISQVKKVTRKEYENQFGYDKKKAVSHLTKMEELGLIQKKGSGPSTYYET